MGRAVDRRSGRKKAPPCWTSCLLFCLRLMSGCTSLLIGSLYFLKTDFCLGVRCTAFPCVTLIAALQTVFKTSSGQFLMRAKFWTGSGLAAMSFIYRLIRVFRPVDFRFLLTITIQAITLSPFSTHLYTRQINCLLLFWENVCPYSHLLRGVLAQIHQKVTVWGLSGILKGIH